jgi:hypothetical protein
MRRLTNQPLPDTRLTTNKISAACAGEDPSEQNDPNSILVPAGWASPDPAVSKPPGADLAQQIWAEQERTKIRDTGHFAYSTLAKAAALRRANLVASVADLKTKFDAAKRELDEVTEELRDLELAHSDTPSTIDVAA